MSGLEKTGLKYLEAIARKYAQCWLSCYPWPQRCVHDLGGEFTGPEFQTLLENCHIKDVCTSAKNPQSNAVCERMHQTVGNVLITFYCMVNHHTKYYHCKRICR